MVTSLPEILVKEKEKWAKSVPLMTSWLFIKASKARMPSGNGWPEREVSGTKTGFEITCGGGALGGRTKGSGNGAGGVISGGAGGTVTCAAVDAGGFCLCTQAVSKTLVKTRPAQTPLFFMHQLLRNLAVFTRSNHNRFNALKTALTEASSILVSTPAPQRVIPLTILI